MIIPTLGQRLDLLQLSLESVKNQHADYMDLVVVCPLANKKAVQLSKQYDAKIIDDPGGLSAAVNAGIETATKNHTYITWMGDDDLLAPGSIKATKKALDHNPDAVVAFGYCEYIDENGALLFKSKAGRLAPWLMSWGPNLIPLPGALFRLDSLKEIGLFNPSLKYAMDLDVFLKLKRKGKFINTKSTVSSFRWHVNSTTVSQRGKSLKEAQDVKRSHLPAYVRPLSILWEIPVQAATKVASRRINRSRK